MFRFNFHVVLSAPSAVLLAQNCSFWCRQGRERCCCNARPSACQQTVNLVCHDDLAIALPGYYVFLSGSILWQTGCVSSIMIYVQGHSTSIHLP